MLPKRHLTNTFPLFDTKAKNVIDSCSMNTIAFLFVDLTDYFSQH